MVFFFQTCFCPSGKSKALSLQALRTSVSSSFSYPKQECASSSSPSPSKRANSTPTKSFTPDFNTTTSIAASPHPAAPPARLVVPAVRSRRAPQEVLKPVLLVLPSVHFPAFFPPSQTRFSHSLNYKWKTPAHIASLTRSSGALSKDA